jgi:aminopeptidase N
MDNTYQEQPKAYTPMTGTLNSAGVSPVKETLMNRELSSLDLEIERMNSNLSQLGKRLIPVLNMTPETDSLDKEPEQVLPELIDRVKQARKKIANLANVTLMLTNKLEI